MISGQTPLLVSGVPNGVRTSWAYKIDTDRARGFAGGRMTRLDDPRMTPEFLQDTPEHDRLWFEQKPPRDFDWDK